MKRTTALILTANYGSGHVQVAHTLANHLRERKIEPVVSDLFEESYPVFSTITQSLLMKSFSTHSSFYKWFYYGADKLNSNGLIQFSSYLGRKRLFELVYRVRPDFILLTFPLHAASALIKKSRMLIPTYTVVTDYCLHPYWINPFTRHYFVSTEAAATQVPLILHQPIHGQELENATFFEEKGAAFISRAPVEAFAHVQTIARNEEVAKRMKARLKNIHTFDSSSVIIDHALRDAPIRSPYVMQ